MASATIRVQNIEVLELNLPKRSKTQVDHKILREQISLGNFPRCKYYSTTNVPSKYDENFTLEIIKHYEKRANYCVDVRFVDGINKGKTMENIRFNDLTKGKFKNDLAKVLNDTEDEKIQEKVEDEKQHKSLLERLRKAEIFRKKAEKERDEAKKERDEEKEKRIKESKEHADQIDSQFKLTRAEYDKRRKAEKQLDKAFELIAIQNGEIQQLQYERDYYKNSAKPYDIRTIIEFYEMGFSADDIEKMFN